MRLVSRSIHLYLILAVFSLSALAQTWEPVKGVDEITALFSDTVMTAMLGGGNNAVATYNADGTGELKAWDDSFEREWKVDGDDLICIKIDRKFQCFRLEKNTEQAGEYRGTKLATGETVIFTVSDQGTDIQQPLKTQAGSPAQPSAAEMAQKLANPTNPIMTIGNNIDYVTFKGDGSLPGADDESAVRYLFQTSFPYKLADGKGTVFLRPAIPVYFNEPLPNANGTGFDTSSVELGDIGFDFSYGNTTKTGWIYGGGVVGSLPTGTEDRLSSDKFSLGPEALFGKLGRWGAVLGLVTHQWDVAGSSSANDVNISSFTYVYAFALGGGWQISAAPVITYNHEAVSGDALTLPLGIGLAKTSIIKGRPWKFQLQYWNYIEGNDAFTPEHLVRLSISPVISAPWNNGR
jgi:hypothetical protein